MSYAIVRFNEEDEVLVNLRARARSIYEYLLEAYNVPADSKCIDLCDESGTLVALDHQPDNSYGSEFLHERQHYYLVIMEVNEEGDQYVNILLGNIKNAADIGAFISKQTKKVTKPPDNNKSRQISSKKKA